MHLYRRSEDELVSALSDIEEMERRMKELHDMVGRFSSRAQLAIFLAGTATMELKSAIAQLKLLANSPLMRGVWENVDKLRDMSISDASFQENLEKLVEDRKYQ